MAGDAPAAAPPPRAVKGADFRVLATDYDGTIASRGVVDEQTLAALDRLRASGRKLVLVTGRELSDLRSVFDHMDRFDVIVAENGAVLFKPGTCREVVITEPASPELVKLLVARGVQPLSVGHAIIATREPYERTVLDVIKALGLEMQVTFNKGAVMVLPSGVNKATGLMAALRELQLNPESTVAIGDAENDHALLDLCGCSVAVGNALPAVKQRADFVTRGTHGAGVAELIDLWLQDGLEESVLKKHAA